MIACKFRHIRAFEAIEIEPDTWRETYYYIDQSGNARGVDQERETYSETERPPLDDYYCVNCGTGLFGWTDVVEHVDDFDDDDDGGVSDGDSLTWKLGFGFGFLCHTG